MPALFTAGRPSRVHRLLAGIVVTGAVAIAGIGFAGSYGAVRTLAIREGFGWFANVFPIGVDAGIVVLLSLDLLLTWLRIPFPLLRQTAWLLTAATIAFNGAAASNPLGVGMHAVIPVLFVVCVEAARHAIGRIADITADRHMEPVRIARWLLAFTSTFRLWRRMRVYELRSYDEVIRLEKDRLVYQARLREKYGRAWRRKAPVEVRMPLRLVRYGVPLPGARGAEASPAAASPEPGSTTGMMAGRPRIEGVPSGGNGAAAPGDTRSAADAYGPAEPVPATAAPAELPAAAGGDVLDPGLPEQPGDPRVRGALKLLADDARIGGAGIAEQLGLSERTGRRVLTSALRHLAAAEQSRDPRAGPEAFGRRHGLREATAARIWQQARDDIRRDTPFLDPADERRQP